MEAVESDPVTYNEVFLGHDAASYCTMISQPTVWGGAIELSIFSRYFDVEIVSIDVETGKTYNFGEDQSSPNRIFVLYSGVHYDAIYMARGDGKENISVFARTDDDALMGALSIAEVERKVPFQ